MMIWLPSAFQPNSAMFLSAFSMREEVGQRDLDQVDLALLAAR